jgi:Ras-related protein Rab-18
MDTHTHTHTGQERFRALTSTFYRGAAGIIFTYDVTRRETLANLGGAWLAELARFEPHPEVAKMVVANKVDAHDARQVSWQEGADFARQHGCLFVETSAKTNIAVAVAFEELVLRILDSPGLLAAVEAEEQRASGGGAALRLGQQQAPGGGMAVSCSC